MSVKPVPDDTNIRGVVEK